MVCFQLIFSLERLQKITSKTPETPHEKSFQDMYSKDIDKAIFAMKNPADPSKPDISWDAAKQVSWKVHYKE